MKNIILKICEGDLYRFVDSEERTELLVGSRRTADIVIRSQYVEPVQIRLLLRNNVWYAEDLTTESARSVVLLDGKKFRRPMMKFDGTLCIRRAGKDKKEKEDIVKISPVRQFTRKKAKNHFDLTAKTITTVGSPGNSATFALRARSSRKNTFLSSLTGKTALLRTRTA